MMRVVRARSSFVTSIALTWQLLAVMFVPATLCCRESDAAKVQGQPDVAMADCPMHHETAAEPSCPLHAAKSPAHECDCPTLGCSQTDKGFMALFGPIGVLPAPAFVAVLHLVSDATSVITPSTSNLAPVPPGPPPRV